MKHCKDVLRKIRQQRGIVKNWKEEEKNEVVIHSKVLEQPEGSGIMGNGGELGLNNKYICENNC